MFSTTDTIVAIATPPGRGGIGVVRVSGPLARDIAGAVTGAVPERAARAGHRLASVVVQYPGAIIPRSATPRLEQLI